MKTLPAVLLLFVSCHAWASMIIETIQLQHRPSDEIIPIIKPMLAPEASITGSGYKLIIKSTPENLSQIQTILEEIDVNQNVLRVYVSMNRQTDGSAKHGSISIRAGNEHNTVTIGPETNDRNKFDARFHEHSSSHNEPNVQVMSVAEGHWASISMGQSIPMTTRTRNPDGTVTETITYADVMTGFDVMPRTHGNNVTLSIRPVKQSVKHGSIETTSAQSTVTGKLGEWLFIGGTNQTENLRSSGIATRSRIRSTDVNQVWVRVERP